MHTLAVLLALNVLASLAPINIYGKSDISIGFVVTMAIIILFGVPGALIVAAVEAFVRAAALDLEGRYRINVVSPVWVAEARVRAGLPPMPGIWVKDLAEYYVRLVEGEATGQVVNVAAGS